MGHLNWQGGSPYSSGAALYYFTPDQQSKFYQPDAGQLSNLGRNFFRLPHNFNVDMTLGKKFAITERQTFQLRLEVQNLTNSVMYDVPYSARITSGMFGYMMGQTFNNARHMQISAKYEF
jgi:outer membrane receptor protein involved in Fe transport